VTPPAPLATNNTIFALPSFQNVTPLYRTVRKHLSEILSAFEFFDRNAYDLALKHGHMAPFSEGEADEATCFVLVETSGCKKEHDDEASVLPVVSVAHTNSDL
jgi:hypothetical protein